MRSWSEWRISAVIWLVGAASLTGGASLAADERQGDFVDLWVRETGQHGDGIERKRVGHKRALLERQPHKTITRYDLQYGETLTWRGLPLLDLVEAYPKLPPEVDLLILRFKNGVQIPLPVEDDWQTLKRVDAFVAIRMKSKETKKWTGKFPDLGRLDEKWRDPVPLRFGGNRLVVKDGWHPLVTDRDFSPFRHADTLTGIEFVNSAAYDAQLDLAGAMPEVKAGYQVFRERCQYCHGVRKIGADYGWDFLTPVPIFEFKQPNHLYYKVKYSYHDALERGLAMPTQKSVTESEMEMMSQWLRQLAETNPRPYKP